MHHLQILSIHEYRNKVEKDVDGSASAKLLPKLVVTHVTDSESSSELEGNMKFLVFSKLSL